MDDSFAAPRLDYDGEPLPDDGLPAEPMELFAVWFEAAVADGVALPDAMVLATADAAGRPSARAVVLRGYDRRGLVFYTDGGSAKAADLAVRPQAALCFQWPPPHRQIRVEGPVEMLSAPENDAYFASRPRGAQLAAWVRPQSEVAAGRADLERRFTAAEERFAAGDVPRPAEWVGYRVRPDVVEFWQGRANRLHDRIRYRRAGDAWVAERLVP